MTDGKIGPQREHCMFFDHLAHILQGVRQSSIPAAVGVNSTSQYGDEAQANMNMSALIHAARIVLLQLSKQCETQFVLHTVLLWEELLARVSLLYMLTNWCILQLSNSVIFQTLARHLNNQRKQEILDILNRCGCQRCQRGWSERSSSLTEDKFEINSDLACTASQCALTVVAKKYSNTGKTSLYGSHTFTKNSQHFDKLSVNTITVFITVAYVFPFAKDF